MAPRRGTIRRDFLKTSALALAGLGVAPGASLKLKKPVKIGCQTILSGPLGGYGEFTRKGAMMAMEEINGQGGIGSRGGRSRAWHPRRPPRWACATCPTTAASSPT
jgi:hypothetical protein